MMSETTPTVNQPGGSIPRPRASYCDRGKLIFRKGFWRAGIVRGDWSWGISPLVCPQVSACEQQVDVLALT